MQNTDGWRAEVKIPILLHMFQARQLLETEFDRLLREGTNRQMSDGKPGSWDRAGRVRPPANPDDEDDDDTISASDQV